MDTKLKKSKLIISFLSFFIGMSLLITGILTGMDSNEIQLNDLGETDYQETSAFMSFISNRLQIFIRMAAGETLYPETVENTESKDYLAMAQAFHENHCHDKNLIYSIAYKGKVLYSNDEEYEGKLEDAAALPSEYNFWLCFDGKRVTIQKDGIEIDVYGDGYYRDDSDWYIPGYKNITADEKFADVTIYMAAARTPVPYAYALYITDYYRFQNDDVYAIYRSTMNRFIYLKVILAVIAFDAVMLLISAVLSKSRMQLVTLLASWSRKLFLELRIVIFGIFTFIMYGVFYMLFHELLGTHYWHSQVYAACITGFWLMYFVWNDFWKNRPVWKQSLIYRCLRYLTHTLPQKITAVKLPYAKRMLLRFLPLLIFCGTGTLFCAFLFLTLVWDGINYGGEALLIALMLFIGAGIIVLPFWYLFRRNMRLAADLDLLSQKIASIHDGDYRNSYEIAGSSELSPLAEQLDGIRNGMSTAVEERIKSERMKVELITNVSHDLKTPLTSIISYVELLKQESSLPEHVKDYVKILDEKALRLNQMIQDVFTVSKAASGQLPVNLEKIDFAKLLRQTLADMGEQIDAGAFQIKTNIPQEAVIIEADGQRMYRVFQNLIQNALKYSLESSRIYITLTVEHNIACASVKNISAQEIDPSTDFSERFVRGDISRSDGGNGLGLSIAKTFTESCGGTFSIEVNADLFIVTVSFEII